METGWVFYSLFLSQKRRQLSANIWSCLHSDPWWETQKKMHQLSVCLSVCLSFWRNDQQDDLCVIHVWCSRCTADWPLTQTVHDQIISFMRFTCVWPIWACLTISNPPSTHLFPPTSSSSSSSSTSALLLLLFLTDESSCRHPLSLSLSLCLSLRLSLSFGQSLVEAWCQQYCSRGRSGGTIIYFTTASNFDTVSQLAVSEDALSLSPLWHADTILHISQWGASIDCNSWP